MKTSSKLVLALLAVVSCAAGAQTYSSQADQERRERNREEAMAEYRAHGADSTRMTTRERHESAREEAGEAKDRVRHGAHTAADSTRRVAHKTANEGRRVGHNVASESRRVGHNVAVKARESTERADAKFGTVEKKDAKGEASNPTGLNNTAANGPKP